MVLCRPLTFNLCLFGLDAGQVSRGPAEPDRGQGRREVRHQRRLHREDLAHQQKQIRHRSQFGYFSLFHPSSLGFTYIYNLVVVSGLPLMQL